VTTRRAFLDTLAGGLLGAPRIADAQLVGKVYRMGFLGGAGPAGYAALLDSLRAGLQERGYVEGQNLAVEFRWADGHYARLATLAAELVHLKVDVIVTQGTPAALAAKRATKTIPIVMAIVGNPVETGIVASYARPGGNITGSSFFWGEVTAKRVELLKTLQPSLTRVGALQNPENPAMASLLRAMQERGQSLGVHVTPIGVKAVAELEPALDLARSQVDAVTVVDDGIFIANVGLIAELARKRRLPSMGFREYCEAGGLAAYGVDFPYIWHQAAGLIDKILRGARPADLPIEQASRFELVVNLKTAKVIGLTVPPSVLARADQIIE